MVTFAQLFGALMNVTARLLELEGDGMKPFQLLFVRQGLTAILCTAWMWWQKVPDFPLGAKGIRKLLIIRSCSGFFGIYGMYCKFLLKGRGWFTNWYVDSLQYLPVADAVVLTFLAPSVASYGCYLFLKEPFPRSAQYASLIALIGVFMIARPTSFFSPGPESSITSPSNTTTISADAPLGTAFPTPTSAQRLSAVGVAMLGVLGAAGALTSIRWIGNQAHPLISVNYFSILCTIVAALVLSLAEPLNIASNLHFELPNGLRQWSLLLFLGV